MKKKNLIISVIFAITFVSSCSNIDNSSDTTSTSTSVSDEGGSLDFNDLYSFGSKLTTDNISSVTTTINPGTICPPWLHDVYTSTESSYFEKIIYFINETTLTPCFDPIYGIGSYSIVIRTALNTYSLSFSDCDEFYVNSSVYTSSLEFPIEATNANKNYSYYSTPSDFVFKSFDTEQILDSSCLSNFHFVDSSTESDFYDFTKDASIVLDSNVCFTIEDNDTFYINFDKYEIIGDTDFSELLTGVEDSTSFLRIYLESTDLLIKIKVSNNVEYSYDELFSTAMLNIKDSQNYELCTEDGNLYEGGEINSDSNLLMKTFVIE